VGKGGGALPSAFNGSNDFACEKLVACPTKIKGGACSGESKLSLGLWPLEGCASGAAAQGHGGCANNGQGKPMTQADVEGIGRSLLNRGASAISVWDAFGSVPGKSIPEFWWAMFGRFMKAT